MQNFVSKVECIPFDNSGGYCPPSGQWPFSEDLESLIDVVNETWRDSGANFVRTAHLLELSARSVMAKMFNTVPKNARHKKVVANVDMALGELRFTIGYSPSSDVSVSTSGISQPDYDDYI